MSDHAEGHRHDPVNLVSDREAGQLLLAFLTAVILVLAAATVPMDATLPQTAGESTVVTDDEEASEADRAKLRPKS